MNFDDMVAKEKVLAKVSAHMTFSSRIRLFLHSRKSGYSGELFVTDSYLCFKGKVRKSEIVAIWLGIFMAIILTLLNVLYFNRYPFGGTSFYVVAFQMIITGAMSIPFFIPYLPHRKLNRGVVWVSANVGIDVTGNMLAINEGKQKTLIRIADETSDIFELLGSKLNVLFEIHDVSKLGYHEKLTILEDRYKAGKISKELYEELKRKIPYT